MTKHAAMTAALRRAKQRRREYFVVWSDEPMDSPGQHYHIANDEDVDTFYLGCEVIAVVQPDGCIDGCSA